MENSAAIEQAPVRTKKKKKSFFQKVNENKTYLLFVLPGTLFLIIFFYIPVFANIVAFQNFQYSEKGFLWSLLTSPFVGFKNFEFFFKSADFMLVLRNTVGYSLTFLLLNFFFAIFFGIVMSQLRNHRALRVYQTSMLFPYFLSWAILAYFVYAFLSTDKGIINHWITGGGGTAIDFYNAPQFWPFIIIFMGVWKGIGYNSILYFATASGIDPSYYDAAMIDGANKWQQIRNVTLPHIMPVATLMLILNIGGIFRSDFGLFYLLPRTSGTLINVTQTFDTYIYRALTTTNDIGMSTAAGLVQSVVGAALIIITNLIVRKRQPDAALF
ncbi:ABC transporter permease [Lacticaseibacillus yichunensis]|uniref:ABC transporter permease n=1 Tax=Lacticaseibacillus yichunensis TaxID=2486015 RepID=A0ABW4CQZ4_9LACO|nr:ABC transporter permease subunit [Lacticaseibacillus yichunensis]